VYLSYFINLISSTDDMCYCFLDAKKVGDFCVKTEQCTKNAECELGICTCKSGSSRNVHSLKCELKKSK
jgi:hypothetical protein